MRIAAHSGQALQGVGDVTVTPATVIVHASSHAMPEAVGVEVATITPPPPPVRVTPFLSRVMVSMTSS